MHHHIQQNRSRKRLKRSVGKYFCTRITHQTWLCPITLHALSDQHFTSYENVRKWLDDWFASKERQFFWRGIHQLPDRWEKCIASDGQYFELNILNHFHTIKVYFLYKNSGFIFTYLVCRIIQTEGSQFEHLKVSSC